MTIGPLPQYPASRGALYEPLLDEEGLDHLLDGVPLLRQGGGQGLHPDGTAAIGLGDAAQVMAIHGVEAAGVHVEAA